MTASKRNLVSNIDIADPHWKDLYRIGAISCLVVAGMVIFAVIAFFIWPFKTQR